MSSDLARMIDLRVAERIRARRRRLGLTQQQLAKIVGVAFQQAHKYEHGLSRISAGRLYHIATALKVPIGYFFAAEEPDTVVATSEERASRVGARRFSRGNEAH